MQSARAERTLLLSVVHSGTTAWAAEEDAAELLGLAQTAGANVVASARQQITKPHPAHLVGKGKVDEVAALVRRHDVETVVVGEDLSPVWQRNLEHALGAKVVDRTELILDIFAQHARSRDGQIQVELAQLRYRLPRLTGRGVYLSRLGGGIGTRGPGETQLEIDRRRITARISRLKKAVERLSRIRAQQRKRRIRQKRPQVSIVGYTNAGKSTLLNALTGADVVVEDQLFSTLDPTTRQARLPAGEVVLFSDTVGFIQRLPETLRQAFRATLEEVLYADLVAHVADSASPFLEDNVRTVERVLADLGVQDERVLLVLNKTDLVDDPAKVEALLLRYSGSVAISARNREGLDDLLMRIQSRLREERQLVTVEIPVDEGRLISRLRREGKVLEERLDGNRLRFRAVLPDEEVGRFRAYILGATK
jgi:GTP-binding protein HflX